MISEEAAHFLNSCRKRLQGYFDFKVYILLLLLLILLLLLLFLLLLLLLLLTAKMSQRHMRILSSH